LFFFFSSRRRHTRFKCDWSSDVCSSDLVAHRGACLVLRTVLLQRRARLGGGRGRGTGGIAHRRPGRRRRERLSLPRLRRLEIHRSEEHTSELQSHLNLVCRLLLEKKKK